MLPHAMLRYASNASYAMLCYAFPTNPHGTAPPMRALPANLNDTALPTQPLARQSQ